MVYSVQSRISVFEPTQKLGGRSKEKETELIQIIWVKKEKSFLL